VLTVGRDAAVRNFSGAEVARSRAAQVRWCGGAAVVRDGAVLVRRCGGAALVRRRAGVVLRWCGGFKPGRDNKHAPPPDTEENLKSANRIVITFAL
jgi:hypothetical protein